MVLQGTELEHKLEAVSNMPPNEPPCSALQGIQFDLMLSSELYIVNL